MKAMEVPHLVFNWTEKRRSLSVLAWFIAFSFSLHALAFYILQAKYPGAATTNPPPAQVSLLVPATPGYRTLMQWVEAENPEAVMSPRDTLPAGTGQLRYEPSFLNANALPKPASGNVVPVIFPPARVEPPVTSAIATTGTFEKPIFQATEFQFSGGLGGRALKNRSAIHINRSGTTPLQPVSFFLGVSDRGEVRFIFPDRSSGDNNVDRQVESCLSRIEFTADDHAITWGNATCFFGNDAPAGKESRP